MPAPHGGKLVYRVNNKIEIADLPEIRIDEDMAKEVENIAYGVFSPIEGFICKNDFESILEHMRLENDIPWTIPIVFDIENGIKEGDEIILKAESGTTALFKIEEIYGYDKKKYAEQIFRTIDSAHPGVKRIMEMREKFAGGKITLIREGEEKFKKYYLKPYETRILFKEKGWRDVVAFQTRNVPHIGHEYVQKTALTFVDGIFINPIIGKKKKGDFKDEVILKSYETLIKNYYLKERAVMSILRTMMRYAGPREAIFHAIMRKNFGCTHFIVGRDHAGVGNYYGPYDAHEIFNEFPDLGITPIFFRSFFYCKKCGGVVNEKICPHGKEYHIYYSGTTIREMLIKGETPPENMMRKEVAEIIMSYENPFVE
ncbi:MAG TPA: sulfate adenylyltransferase [Thermoplasmatales archaeon]|nr:sulfate adenylyltransferase [Thermoplasmatales archaeon]